MSPTRVQPGTYATFIDVRRCDGCPGEAMPRCVKACRTVNENKFPRPQEPIRDLWPQKTHDDWSRKKDVFSTLTPYNWTTVQKVEAGGQELFIPRRCMHCDNLPCANLCPFGAMSKLEDGAVVIDAHACLGGAKCKSVCPWNIPQRQSGVGIYLKLQPMPAGGGVMYKCDLCHDRLGQGLVPACVDACQKRLGDKKALFFGSRAEMQSMARERAKEINGFIYGAEENGGTATLYLSPVPFEEINRALKQKKTAPFMGKMRNALDDVNRWAKGFWISPLLSAAGALGLALYRRRQERKEGR